MKIISDEKISNLKAFAVREMNAANMKKFFKAMNSLESVTVVDVEMGSFKLSFHGEIPDNCPLPILIRRQTITKPKEEQCGSQ